MFDPRFGSTLLPHRTCISTTVQCYQRSARRQWPYFSCMIYRSSAKPKQPGDPSKITIGLFSFRQNR